MRMPDGIVAVVKQDCPTCVLVDPVLQEMEARGLHVTVYAQDDPQFPGVSNVITIANWKLRSASTSRPCPR